MNQQQREQYREVAEGLRATDELPDRLTDHTARILELQADGVGQKAALEQAREEFDDSGEKQARAFEDGDGPRESGDLMAIVRALADELDRDPSEIADVVSEMLDDETQGMGQKTHPQNQTGGDDVKTDDLGRPKNPVEVVDSGTGAVDDRIEKIADRGGW